MKNVILIFMLLLIYSNTFAQDDCDPDILAPTFELPMYLTEGIVYDCLDSVPPLTDMTDQAVMDLVFATLVDNCLNTNVPPWYGPQLTAGVLNITSTSITYTFTASDDGPNYNSQQITFYFGETCEVVNIDTIPPTIECPDMLVLDTDSSLCGAAITDIGLALASDNVGIQSIWNEGLLDIYPIGSNLIFWHASDSSGNVSTCVQLILVVDNEPPTIICAEDQIEYITPENTEVAIAITLPEIDDNCYLPILTNDLTGTSNADGIYPIGTTIIIWTVTDSAGAVTNCIQNIIVEIDSISLDIPKWEWDDVKVYPNPSSGNFTITSRYSYQILDYMGINQDEDSLISGVYLIRIAGRISKTKLIIQK